MPTTEVQTIATIDEALSELEPEAALRVLRWAGDKYGDATVATAPSTDSNRNEHVYGNGNGHAEPAPMFQEVADLMSAATPSNGVERVLVAAYWFQALNGAPNVTGQQVNDELKNLGYRAGNITDTFTSLITRKPALAMQVQKSGSTRQARKRYKLTVEGINYVKRMLSTEVSAE